MKPAFSTPFAVALVMLALAGCESRQEPAAAATAGARTGLWVSDGRLVLPPVKGNPGAVYFTVHNGSAQDEFITGAEVKGAASAMIHQTSMANGMAGMRMMSQAKVPAHGDLVFAPGGLHVMAMDLGGSLAKGGTTQVTLTFGSGARAEFPADILAAGDAR